MANHSPTSPAAVEPEAPPWYRQFWPWFLIALPATVVVAGIATLFIAIDNRSSLVVDDYYKQGLGINRTLEEDRSAVELGLAAELNLDLATGEIYVVMTGSDSLGETLSLQWIHPTDGSRDIALTLQRSGDNRYRGQLPRQPRGRWYIHLQGTQPRDWLLRSELRVDSDDRLQLQFGAL